MRPSSRRLVSTLRLVASALAVVAATGLLAGALGSPARADDLPGRIDLTTQGVVLQSQRDFRWADFKLGLASDPKNTFARCGCLLATLSTVIESTPGFTSASLPWFAHSEHARFELGTQLVLSFAPNYLDEFLISGRDPAKPRQRGWGYSPESGTNCGVFVEPWGLEDIAIPATENGGAITPSGFTLRSEDGWHPEIAAANLVAGRPTIVGVRLEDGTRHAELIVGWEPADKQFLALDPMWETGSGGAPGFVLDPVGGSDQQAYAHWLNSIVMTFDVEPTNVAHRWLWLEDDPEPIRLLSIDPSGRREGFDPETGADVHEDPRAFSRTFTSWADPLGEIAAADPARALYVQDPVAGTYGFEVVGTGAGPFTLHFGTTVEHEPRVAQTITGTIAKGEIHRYEVTYSPSGTASVRLVDRFAPRARAGNDVSTLVSQPVRFDGTSSYDIGGSIATYSWEFGDRSSGTGPVLDHAYLAPGTYVANLTIKNALGLTASDSRVVRVFGDSSKTTIRASVTAAGREVVGASVEPSLTPDGRYVAFQSTGDITGDGAAGAPAVFVKDLQTGAVERISVSQGGAQVDGESPAISADGRFVAFESSAAAVPGDSNSVVDVFVRDRIAHTIERVSVASDGAEANGSSLGRPAISADGRFVAFTSEASNLMPGDSNAAADVFVRDRQTGVTERVSVSSTGEQPAFGRGAGAPAISGNGRYVAFNSSAENLVPALANGWSDVFVRDRELGTTEVASLASDGSALQDDGFAPSISADGRFVAFDSESRGVTPDDPNDWQDVFVRDRLNRTTELISVSTRGVAGDAQSFTGTITRDGRYVAYYSLADDLVPGDTNRQQDGESPRGLDVFLFDRKQRTTERVSVSTAGAQALPNGIGVPYGSPAAADDGTVAFPASAGSLVADDFNFSHDVFVHGGGGGGQAQRPLANVSGPYVGWAGAPVRLDASGSMSRAGGALSATWSFGDGSAATTGGLQTSHVYAAPGVYTISVAVREGSLDSESATTSVEVLPALAAESLSVTPTCGSAGTALTIRGVARGPNAGLVDGGWDLSKGVLRPRDVELVLPWATVGVTPTPATFVFERAVVLPAALAGGSHRIAVAGGPDAEFTIPCPAAGNRRPVADAGGPYSGSAGQPLTLDGSRSRDPEGSALTYRWDFGDGTTGSGVRPAHVYRTGGVYLLSLVVNDAHADSAHGVGTHAYALAVISADDVPPLTDAVTNPRPNAAGWNTGDVTVQLSARDNEGGSGVKEIVYTMRGAQTGGDTVAGATAHVTVSAEGETTLSYFARDNAGNAGEPRTLTIRIDRTAPRIDCAANPSLLWPPNHRLVPIDVHVAVNDPLSGPAGLELVAATSSEPGNGLGDGDTPVDIQGFTTGTPDTTGSLRAERSGTGPGRVYSLVYDARDVAGNVGRCTARVTVPHDQT